MRKKNFLLATMLVSVSLQLKAEENVIDGVFAWVNGSSTCYHLSDVPKVTCKDGFAILSLGDSDTPQLKIELKDDATLEITFGTYSDGAGVQTTELTKVEKSGKYIKGGRLIIVKDGKQYDVNGTLIN